MGPFDNPGDRTPQYDTRPITAPNSAGVSLDAYGNPVGGAAPPATSSPAWPTTTQPTAPATSSPAWPTTPPATTGIYESPNPFTQPGAGTLPGIGEKVGADASEKLGAPPSTYDEMFAALGGLGGQGAGSQFWNGVQGKFNTAPASSNWSQMLGLGYAATSPADISAYYDNAVDQAGQDIRRQGAAAGNLGSSATGGRIATAVTDLRSQQAKDQAQYELARTGLMGTLAQNADQQNNANNAAELSWIETGATIAGAAGQEDITRLVAQLSGALGISQDETTRLLASFSTAERAQVLQRMREEDFFARNQVNTDAHAGAANQYYTGTIEGDQQLMNQIWEMLMGSGRVATEAEAAEFERLLGALGIVGDVVTTVVTAGGVGG